MNRRWERGVDSLIATPCPRDLAGGSPLLRPRHQLQRQPILRLRRRPAPTRRRRHKARLPARSVLSLPHRFLMGQCEGSGNTISTLAPSPSLKHAGEGPQENGLPAPPVPEAPAIFPARRGRGSTRSGTIPRLHY